MDQERINNFVSAGGTAYPVTVKTEAGEKTYGGMMMLDFFAAHAMMALANSEDPKKVAAKAYDLAKAMVEHRYATKS